jgi:hypothetical protein
MPAAPRKRTVRAEVSKRDPADARRRELAAIHILLGELMRDGLITDDLYRDLLRGRFKVDSSAVLDRPGRLALLDDLRALRGQKARAKSLYHQRLAHWRPQGTRPGMATAEQLAHIEELSERAFTAADKGHALRKFLYRMALVSDLRFLEASKASQVIEALKKMAARR